MQRPSLKLMLLGVIILLFGLTLAFAGIVEVLMGAAQANLRYDLQPSPLMRGICVPAILIAAVAGLVAGILGFARED